ncbi:MAG: beta-1,3-glucanase family protein, partial [Chthoniobacterales bacterium]
MRSLLFTGLAAITFFIPSAFALLQVQVVNDSGLPDNEVFLLLTGQPLNTALNKGPIKVAGIGVANSTGGVKNDPPVKGLAVSALQNTGEKLVSKFSGRTLPIYGFTMETLASGVLYVSYRKPLEWVSAAPTARENIRFDKLELTFDAAIVSVANLTSIDFFGIPMQLERFVRNLDKLTLTQTHTFYTSTPTLLEKLAALGMSGAFVSTSGAPWPMSKDFTNFARVVGPGQYAASSPTGSPAPYPSFDGYLQSLMKSNYTFKEKGFANDCHYDYTGRVEGDGAGGYLIRMKGTTTPPPPAPLPANSEIVLPLPNGRQPGAKQAQNLDHFIYGAVLNPDSIVLSGSGLTPDVSLATVPNSVYGWIAADVFSGLN